MDKMLGNFQFVTFNYKTLTFTLRGYAYCVGVNVDLILSPFDDLEIQI